MKKLIYVSLLILGTAGLSSFTIKKDSSTAKHDSVSDRVGLGHADDRVGLGHADDRVGLGHADARSTRHNADRVGLGHAD